MSPSGHSAEQLRQGLRSSPKGGLNPPPCTGWDRHGAQRAAQLAQPPALALVVLGMNPAAFTISKVFIESQVLDFTSLRKVNKRESHTEHSGLKG